MRLLQDVDAVGFWASRIIHELTIDGVLASLSRLFLVHGSH
jgi:hypothetical protein